MKEYPVTQDNIDEMRVAASGNRFDLGVASGLLGFAINVVLTLTFSPLETTDPRFYAWATMGTCALVGAVVSAIRYYNRPMRIEVLLDKIERETDHG
jgi:hypothetical protein